MAPTRLQVAGQDGGTPKALPGVPAPLSGSGRAHSLAHVLEIALAQAGPSLGYDAVMGISGLAFRTPADPWAPGLTAEEAAAAVEALNAALEPGLELHRAGGDLTPDRAIDLVAACIDGGRPCAALGWGSVKESWSVICGYDRARGRLLGHCVLDTPREQYESWPPTLELLIAMPGRPGPSGPGALAEAVRRAGDAWEQTGRERYGRWVAAVHALDAAPPPEHVAAVELLADARNAAAAFVAALAERREAIPAAWLSRAAERYREIVELLEAADVPRTSEALALLDDEPARRAWADSLAAVARAEEAAAHDLRMSLTADDPPGDADGC